MRQSTNKPALLESLEMRWMLASAVTGLVGTTPMGTGATVKTAASITAPSQVTADAMGRSHQITIHWADVSGETGYSIERSTDGATWTPVGATAADQTSFSDTNLPENATFRYRVIAGTDTGPGTPSAAATATTATYRIWDGSKFINQPTPMAPGIDQLHIVPGGSLYNKRGSLVLKKVMTAAQEAQQLHQVLVLDVEHWFLDTRYFSAAQIDSSIAEMTQVVSTIRKTAPDVKLGFYNLTPNEPPVDMTNASQIAAWKASTDYVMSRMPEPDYYFPAIYPRFETWVDANEWAISNEAKLKEAARFGKPVYAFAYMHDLDTGSSVPGDYWQMQLATARLYADGVVIWGGSEPWDPNAPWLKATQQVQAETVAPTNPPTNLVIHGEGAQLTWDALPSNVDGVIIEKSSDGLNFNRAGIAFGDETTWSDAILTSASTIYYRLRTFNGFGISPAGPASSAYITRNARIVNQSESRENERFDSRFRHETTAGNGQWQQFKAVNFGDGAGVNQLLVKMYAPPQADGETLTLRLDSLDGPVVGTATISPSAVLTDRQLYTVAVNNVTGMHDLYFTFSGGSGGVNLDYWQFRVNQAPAKPVALKSSSFGSGVNLRWTDLSGDETQFLLQRSSDRTNYQTLATLGANTTTYRDENFPATGRYDYRVVAVNAYGASMPSTTAGGRFGALNPYVKAEAEMVDEVGGGAAVFPGIGVALNYTSWMRLYGVDFGAGGAGKLDVNITLPKFAEGNYLDIRLDSVDGPIVGTLKTVATGPDRARGNKPDGWHHYVVQSLAISGATGIHEVYFVSRSTTSLGSIDWYQFYPADAATSSRTITTMNAVKVEPVTPPTSTASQILQDESSDDELDF